MISTEINITPLQTSLYWENPILNRQFFSNQITSLKNQTDVIVLPEMFTTGFSMRTKKLAEKMDGETVLWMHEMAKETDAVITGSIIIEENDNYFNRLIWMPPSGEYSYYDKRHLFSMANEHQHFSGGNNKLIVEWKGWKLCPMICYDLRFPVWSRQDQENLYDVLIYVANWPKSRINAWGKLLEARAIENQCYVVGVNRIGKDKKGMEYNGSSAVINPYGNSIFDIPVDEASNTTVKLDYELLYNFRLSFPVGNDADEFEIN